MNPIFTILEFGGVQRPIGNFGIMLAVAMLVAAVVATRAASRGGIDSGSAIAAAGFTAAGALFGASFLYHVVEFFRTGSVSSAFATQGIVFYGAPIGGALALYFTAPRLGLPLGRFLDLAVPGIPMAHAMGRLGCFFGGCCFGRPYDGPFSVQYTHPLAPAAQESVFRHAVPLYESALLLMLAALLMFWPKRRVGSGEHVGVYLAVYAVIRATTETFRGDGVRGVWFGVSTSQWISIGMFLVGVWLLQRARRPLPSPA
ncbi:MAG: prolipoprotein diacylglyceryl transferase family protein [Myxococcota bacterium]